MRLEEVLSHSSISFKTGTDETRDAVPLSKIIDHDVIKDNILFIFTVELVVFMLKCGLQVHSALAFVMNLFSRLVVCVHPQTNDEKKTKRQTLFPFPLCFFITIFVEIT